MKVLVAGDYVPTNRVAKLVEQKDYQAVFGEVRPLLKEVDYSIVNLEAPVINGKDTPIVKTGPNLKCTENAVESIQWAGFDCVTLANNHFRDQGEQGVRDTLSACDKYGIDHVGGGLNLQDAQKILYKEINGEILAVVNFCEIEWSIASDEYGGSAPLNPVQNYYQIREARQNADYVLVIVHGGIEMYQYPTPRMQETYRFFIDAGADAVVNHHQHCHSGYEVHHDKPIFYGLGNFCFDKQSSNDLWQKGFAVQLSFSKEGIWYNLYPYLQCGVIPNIFLLKEKESVTFFDKIDGINRIVVNSDALEKSFDNYIKIVKSSRLLNLEPIYSRYVRILQDKRLLPRQIVGRSMRDWCVRLTCESHNDIISRILFEEINK